MSDHTHRNEPLSSYSDEEAETVTRFLIDIASKFLYQDEDGETHACMGCLSHLLMEADSSQEEHYNRDFEAFMAGAETAISMFVKYSLDTNPRLRERVDKQIIEDLLDESSEEF